MSPDPLTEPFVKATLPPVAAPSVWSQLGWADITEAEHQNMDLVPAYFDQQLNPGCPECGSAWLELLALGFTAPRMYLGEAEWDGRYFNLSTPAREGLDLRAVRVRCHLEHSFEFDSYTGATRKHAAVPSWTVLVAGGLALMAYCYAMGNATGSR